MIKPELRDLIERTIRGELAPIAVKSVDVEERADHDDAEALYITVDLSPETGPLSGSKLLAAMTAVSAATLDLGEERFPYVRTRQAEDAEREDASTSP